MRRQLLPYTERLLQFEIDRLLREKKERPGRPLDPPRVPGGDLEKLRENFGEILIGKVTVE
jgi:hypothetical protein